MNGQIRMFPDFLNDMSFEERKERKEKLMREEIQYMYDNSPEYYQVKMKECGAEPGDIQTIEDLKKLPIMMDKDRERQSMETSLEKYGHPFGLNVCCHPDDIVQTGGTSGTTGHPTFPYSATAEDREFIAGAVDAMHRAIGLDRSDRAFFLYPLGAYATSAVLPGLEKTGILPLAIDIRLGPQVAMELVKWTRPTFWYSGSAIAEFFVDLLRNNFKMDPRDLNFKCLILGGEMGCGFPELKKKVEDAFGCRWYDWWGPCLTCLAASCDSDEYHGLHNFADDWDITLEDLIDPVTREPIESVEGAVGEIVVTHLQKKAAPYLKYATGDIIELYTSECPSCGFNGYRCRPIGRSDDLITVKGVNVFAGAIHKTLQSFVPRVTGHMRIIKEDPSHRIVNLKIKAEFSKEFGNNQEKLDALAKEIRTTMKESHRVNPEITWVEPESLERPIRKPILFEKNY